MRVATGLAELPLTGRRSGLLVNASDNPFAFAQWSAAVSQRLNIGVQRNRRFD